MIEVADLVPPERVHLDVKAGAKRQVLQALAELASPACGLPAERIAVALEQREQLGTTGLGGGIALPHARMAGIDTLTGFLIRLARPVDFEAMDGQAVDLVTVLLAPEDSGGLHLKALACLARTLRDPDTVAALRRAANVAEISAVLRHCSAHAGPTR